MSHLVSIVSGILGSLSFPFGVIEERFYGPSGEEVPLLFAFGVDSVSYHRALNFVRVGDRIFVDCFFKPLVFPLTNGSGEVIYITASNSIFAKSPVHAQYSAMMVYALEKVPLRGQHFLDLGAGDGLCSLLAKIRGASSVTSIDLNSQVLENLYKYLELNELAYDGVHTSCDDITSCDFKDRLPLNKITVVCANLGANQYENDPNIASILLLEHLPNVKYFLGGGYSEDPKHSPENDISLLRRFGFDKLHWIKQRKCEEYPNPKVTFIAERV